MGAHRSTAAARVKRVRRRKNETTRLRAAEKKGEKKATK